MVRRVHLALLRIFQRLPVGARRGAVRTIAPGFTVGSMCFVERADGSLLLVRHSYRRRWGVPGGLLQRGEAPEEAAVREAKEEVGIDIELVGTPVVSVDVEARRVDIVFRARPADPAAAPEARPCSVEIEEVAWYPPESLPELQFETSAALVVMARSARSPQGPILGPPLRRWPDVG